MKVPSVTIWRFIPSLFESETIQLAEELFLFFPMALQPNAGHGLLILDEVSRSHTTTHHSQ